MALYLISYDLNRPEQNYPELITALRNLGAQRALYSQWAVQRTGTTPQGLRDYVWQFMDANDRLLVADMTSGGYAWYNLMVNIDIV